MNPHHDEAISARLARLRSTPVDTSVLEARIAAAIPRDGGADSTSGAEAAIGASWRSPLRLRFQPLRAVAASVVLLAALGAALVAWNARPALASTSVMARLHDDLVAGRTESVQVDSIERACVELGAQANDVPDLPGMSSEHVGGQVVACCMRPVQNKRVACVLLRAEGVPVTMVVASARDIRIPECPPDCVMPIASGGTCNVQSQGKLNMVMLDRGDRWICLIAELPKGKLMEIASKLQ